MPLGKGFVDWHRQAVEAQDTPEREGLEDDLDEAVRVAQDAAPKTGGGD